ncbi:DUF2076 domain-containing protein [Terriglobus sp. RCC_193]|uniref:DUF2076 domain-containing protein n=1 Tax=Terriglobus sp. RCC_193 TaxID=3239218 RepID=UPI003525E481
MTQQEEQLLNGLIERVNSTQLQTKDTDAERLLQTRFSQNPDALYILCQTVLVQQFAMEKSQTDLQAAREEIERLRQSGSGEKHGSFLGNLFGLNKEEPQQAPPPAQYNNPTGTSAGNASYAPVRNAPPAYTQPTGYYPPQPGYPPPPPQAYPGYPLQGGYYAGGYPAPPMGGGMFGGGGGFLQGAMQTAAGVVAGEMAFRALEDVFSSGHERGFTGGETVNNYYDNAGDRDTGGGFGDRLAQADGYGSNISSDIEDRRGESQGFFDSGDNSGSDAFADDSSNFDDSSSDFSGNDDNGF